jgi:hypothetical protein
MLRAILCVTIVAAFPAGSAAAPTSEDIPIPVGTLALAQAVGIESPPDRARFVAEIARLTYEGTPRQRLEPASLLKRLEAHLAAVRDQRLAPEADGAAGARAPTDVVPIPLTAALWAEAVFGRAIPPADLFEAIMLDERAALLCHGLSALDDPTLQYFLDHPSILAPLYQNARVFAAFGSHFRIRDGRVVPPGGDRENGATAVWEQVVGASAATPSQFASELFALTRSRLAYLYDTIGELDPARAAFALGLWIKDPALRIQRVKALASVIAGSFPEWPTVERPFARPTHDVGSMLMSVEVDADGSPRWPGARSLWSAAFEGDTPAGQQAGMAVASGEQGLIDAAWLAERIAASDSRLRARRLEQLAFGYRVLGAEGDRDRDSQLAALRAFPKYRALMLALEQIGITSPAVYVAASRRAEQLSRLEGGRAFVALSQFQGAAALIARMALVGTIDAVEAGSLVSGLAAVPLDGDGRYASGVAAWLRRDVLEEIDDQGAEAALLALLAGGPVATRGEPVTWEGESYLLDLPAAEKRRLRLVRERQGGYTLDAALALESIARDLARPSLDTAGVAAAVQTLKDLQPALTDKVPRRRGDLVPGGASELPEAAGVVARALSALEQIRRPSEVARAVRVASDLAGVTDVVLGDVLRSLAYAVHISDPDGSTLLGGDVARRHEFGIGSPLPSVRSELPWALPEQRIETGLPRHVAGSLTALQAALAPLALRRMSTDGLDRAPVLGSNERETFARSVALLNPFALRDADRDAIAAAIDRGRARVASLASMNAVDPLAETIRMDGWRRRALRWTVANEPDRVLSFFSLTELLVLGGGSLADFHAWGAAMTPLTGCLCSRLMPPNGWRFVTGRPQLGVLSTAVPDLGLHVATRLAELGLPAALARTVLSAAMQDYVDVVRPNDPNDWLTLVREARTLTRERVEDYLAAATAAGGALSPVGREARRDPQP